jgi:hypothetical protein
MREFSGKSSCPFHSNYFVSIIALPHRIQRLLATYETIIKGGTFGNSLNCASKRVSSVRLQNDFKVAD